MELAAVLVMAALLAAAFYAGVRWAKGGLRVEQTYGVVRWHTWLSQADPWVDHPVKGVKYRDERYVEGTYKVYGREGKLLCVVDLAGYLKPDGTLCKGASLHVYQ